MALALALALALELTLELTLALQKRERKMQIPSASDVASAKCERVQVLTAGHQICFRLVHPWSCHLNPFHLSLVTTTFRKHRVCLHVMAFALLFTFCFLFCFVIWYHTIFALRLQIQMRAPHPPKKTSSTSLLSDTAICIADRATEQLLVAHVNETNSTGAVAMCMETLQNVQGLCI